MTHPDIEALQKQAHREHNEKVRRELAAMGKTKLANALIPPEGVDITVSESNNDPS